MKWASNTSQFAVIDDFLSPENWDEVHKCMQLINYYYVGEGGWNGAWRLDDGLVMRGQSISWGEYKDPALRYPTKGGIDRLVEAIASEGKTFQKQLGEFEKDWNSFTVLPMLYPRNTGLYWHRDAKAWAGSYTYYAHREWNIEWGGSLLVADESTQTIGDEYGVFFSKKKEAMGLKDVDSFGAHIDNHEANQLLLERGMGTYIMPKPNRLVILRQGCPHAVSKVLPAAGDHLRMSVSGFFLRPKT